MKLSRWVLAFLMTSFFFGAIFAQEEGHNHEENHNEEHSHEGFVQQAPHVHGVANLQAVVEENNLMLDFTSPAMNLIGFEYEPQTLEDEQTVETAVMWLQQGDELFSPNAKAGCTLQEVNAIHTADLHEHEEHMHEHEHEHEEHMHEEGHEHAEEMHEEGHEHAEEGMAEEMHEHHHKPLFAEFGGLNAGHPAKHMVKGPMKSIIALATPSGNRDNLLYHAGGTHIRYDVLMQGQTAYFEYHAFEPVRHVFFVTEDVSMNLYDNAYAGEVVMSDMLYDNDGVFVKAFVFDLAEGVHVFEVSGSDTLFSMVVEAESTGEEAHEHSHDHGEESGEEAGAHQDEVVHSHEAEGYESHAAEETHTHEHAMEESMTEHEHSHEHEHADGEMHSEFQASYLFTCEYVDALQSLDLAQLFDLYPGIQELDVQYVLPNKQGATELNLYNTKLQF